MLAQNASRPHGSTTSANVQLGERGVWVGDNNNNSNNKSQPTFVYRSQFLIYYPTTTLLPLPLPLPPVVILCALSLSLLVIALTLWTAFASPAPSAAVFR